MDTRTFSCKTCGDQFQSQRKRKYCSQSCRPSEYKPDRRVANCESCGNEFEQDGRQRYCSKSCRPAYYAAKARVKACEGCGSVEYLYSSKLSGKSAFCKSCCKIHRDQIIVDDRRSERGIILPPRLSHKRKSLDEAVCRQDHTCRNCNQVFKPKNAAHIQFCSRGCAHTYQKKVSQLRALMCISVITQRGKCKHCNVPFAKSNGNQEYCSKECYSNKPYIYVEKIVLCKECRKGFVRRESEKNTRFCSQLCKDKSKKRTMRVHKSRRKALERGARTADRIDPIQIFERDGWRCQICGIKTAKDKRGTYHDKAPELDHIIPLSKGGLHSFANVQCTCRKCNGAKSDTTYGQLLLFAQP